MGLSEVPVGTLERVVAGDVDALETVVTMFRPRLLRYANRLRCQPHTAEDAVQEALIRFWDKASVIQEDHHISGWLFRVTRNLILDDQRSFRVHKELPFNPADMSKTISARTLGSMDTYDFLDPYTEARAVMQQVMCHLGTVSRAVLMMRAEGYEYKQIAQRMQVPVGTVKSRVDYAKRRAVQIARRLGWKQQPA
jgi:RNA polymerase sigma-70 factor (ECF subfamily)